MLITPPQSENYGEPEDEKTGTDLKASLPDKRVLTLAFATTAFEGPMHFFVFFWAPALESARLVAGIKDLPPFGLIFSSFTCAMMMGSMLFSSFDPRTSRDAGKLLSFIIAMGAIVLLVPMLLDVEAVTLWSFAVFEVFVVLYFPTMSRLKSEPVEDAVRGKVYALMTLPVNLFIVSALGFTREGDTHRRRGVFGDGGPFAVCGFCGA